jgi:hypothetical protein
MNLSNRLQLQDFTERWELTSAAKLLIFARDELGIFSHEDFSRWAQVKIFWVLEEIFAVDARPYQAPIGIDIDLGYTQLGCMLELVCVHTLCTFELAAGFVDALYLILRDRAAAVHH